MAAPNSLQGAINRFFERAEILRRSRTLRVLRHLEPAFVVFTVIGVIIATIGLWLDLDGRQKSRISEAWQTVSNDLPDNTGKADALEYLAATGQDLRWTDVSRNSIDGGRSVDCRYRVFLPGLDLRRARLDHASFSCSDLDAGDPDTGTARFDKAELYDTKWISSKAERAVFSGSLLRSADFRAARLGQSDFTEADLTQAIFAYADLRGASFDSAGLQGATVLEADMRGVSGLTCETLASLDGWRSACRDAELHCQQPAPRDACGPSAIQPDPGDSTVEHQAPSPPPISQCSAIDLRREIVFRLDQVNKVVGGETIRGSSETCDVARSLFVVAKLSGIIRRPPPKEDETVWIGGSGYGYRHIPFKAGVRSEDFASHSLPDLVTDLLRCELKGLTPVKTALQPAVDEFEVSAASHADRVQACDQTWVDNAIRSWTAVDQAARTLAEIN